MLRSHAAKILFWREQSAFYQEHQIKAKADKGIAFTATDVFLRRNGFYIEVDAHAGYEFIEGSMESPEFRFPDVLDWVRHHLKPLQ